MFKYTVQSYGRELLSTVSQDGAWRCHCSLYYGCCKTNADCYFQFSTFPIKVKITFLSTSKNRY